MLAANPQFQTGTGGATALGGDLNEIPDAS